MEAQSILPNSYTAADFTSSYFGQLPTDTRYKKVTYHDYLPVTSITGANTITFRLDPWSSASFYKLDCALLRASLTCTKGNGDKFGNNTAISITNNPLATLFKSCTISLNSVNVTPHARNYDLRSYFMKVLNNDEAVKDSTMTVGGFYSDTNNSFNDLDDTNWGWQHRRGLFSRTSYSRPTTVAPISVATTVYNNEPFTIVGPLATDFKHCAPIPPGVGIKLEFEINTAEKFFMAAAGADVKFTLKDLTLHVPVEEWEESVYSKLELELAKKSYEINIRRRQLYSYSIAKDSSSYTSESLFLGGPMPIRMFCAVQQTAAFDGKTELNSLEFPRVFALSGEAAEIAEMSFFLNGVNISGLPSTTEFDYMNLMNVCGYTGTPFTNSISIKDFKGGYAIYAFNLATSLDASPALLTPSVRSGQARLKVRFTKNNPVATTLLIYAEFPSVIYVNKKREVSTNFLS